MDGILNYTNLYSLNKTSEIEEGLSAILGLDFKVNQKGTGEVPSGCQVEQSEYVYIN